MDQLVVLQSSFDLFKLLGGIFVWFVFCFCFLFSVGFFVVSWFFVWLVLVSVVAVVVVVVIPSSFDAMSYMLQHPTSKVH